MTLLSDLCSGGLNDIVEDTTPQLGGNLDMNGKNIGGNTEAQLDDAVSKKHTQLCEAADFTKLDGIETGATKYPDTGEQAFLDGDHTKLNGIETGADVTDTANVTSAGALMDSEVDADIKTLTLPANTTISTAGKALIDDASASAQRTTLGLGSAAQRNAEDVMTDGSLLPDGHAIKTYGDTNWSGGGGFWTDAGAYLYPDDPIHANTNTGGIGANCDWYSQDPTFSLSSDGGGLNQEIVSTNTTGKQALVWLERDFTASAGSVELNPMCLYAQTKLSGSGKNYALNIASMIINNGTGDNDCVGIAGRVSKIGNGVGDSCGVWGSAYNKVNQNGGVMGLEGCIYQSAAGMANCDDYLAKWSAALHILSHSTGSNASAGILIGGTGTYRFWNGILMSKTTFAGAGIAGTMGINMASFDSSNYPQHAIKFGHGGEWNTATSHLYCTSNLKLVSRYEQFYYIDEAGDGTDRYVWHGGAPAAPAAALMILTSGTGNLQLKGTLSESSLSLKQEDVERKWELMDSITKAYKHHDGRYLDPALQVKSKMGWGKRPSDLTQVAIECIAELRNRIEQLEKH